MHNFRAHNRNYSAIGGVCVQAIEIEAHTDLHQPSAPTSQDCVNQRSVKHMLLRASFNKTVNVNPNVVEH
jgi:hypothetical protein